MTRTTPLRAVIYARVSSVKQRDEKTIESQLAELPEYVKRQGWTLVDTYVDDGKSAKAGNLAKRHAMRRLLTDATAGAFDVVVVWEIDRLTRSEDQAERGAILGALSIAGVKLASPNGGIIDPRSSEGDLLLGIKAWAAADWLRRHRAGIMAGKSRALAEGRKPAGPTPYGLTYERKTGAWGIDPVRGAIVREVFARIIRGEPLAHVAAQFEAKGAPRAQEREGGKRKAGRWTHARVSDIVKSTTYRGEWLANKARGLVVRVPAIVDDETWHAAQAALRSRRPPNWTRGRHINLCQGLAVCGVCGEPMGVTGGLNQTRYYVCRQKKMCGKNVNRCSNYMRPIEVTDALVWQAVEEYLSSDRPLAAAAPDVNEMKRHEADLRGYERRLEQMEHAEANILSLYRRGKISAGALDRELASAGRERRLVERNRDLAREQLAGASLAQKRAEGMGDALAHLRRKMRNATPAARREILQQLIPPGAGAITMRPGGVVFDGLVQDRNQSGAGPVFPDRASA